MDKVPTGSIPKPRRWCRIQSWGQPTSPSPKSRTHLKGIAVFFKQEVPNLAQASQSSWTGKINKDMDPSLSLSLAKSSNAPKRDKTPLNTKPMHQILRCHLRQVFLLHILFHARLYLVVCDRPIQSSANGWLLPDHRCLYLQIHLKENHLTWLTI